MNVPNPAEEVKALRQTPAGFEDVASRWTERNGKGMRKGRNRR